MSLLVEDGKEVITVECGGCRKKVLWRRCRGVTVMMEKGWEHRWYCPECYDGFEYGRDF